MLQRWWRRAAIRVFDHIQCIVYVLFQLNALVFVLSWVTCTIIRKNNFRIRLLPGCHGLEADAYRFRWRRFACSSQHVPTCKLCGLELEDPAHFIARCPSLSSHRDCQLSTADSSFNLLSMSQSDSMRFVNVVLGVDWIDNSWLQHFLIEFLNSHLQERNSLLLSAHH